MSRFKFYNNNTIITTHKCGTRFLDQVFNLEGWENKVTIDSLIRDYDFEWFIIRDPFEHLQSAIFTVYTANSNELSLKKILMKFIHQKEDHWVYGHYNALVGLRLMKEFKLVHLKDLSRFIDHLGIPNIEYKRTDYINEIKNVDRFQLIKVIKINFPNHYNLLEEMVKDETKYYNMLIDKCEIFV